MAGISKSSKAVSGLEGFFQIELTLKLGQEEQPLANPFVRLQLS